MGPDRFLSETLSCVRRPSRYVGGEWNSIVGHGGRETLSFLLAYPDAYEVGAANLGIQILYQILNACHHVRAERLFAPWMDMEREMRTHAVPLFSLETRSPMASFDVIGFSLQHELNYTNVLNMLDLGHVPLLSQQRGEVFPLVCGGGPCTTNPEPLADFFDFFFLGEAEEAIHEIVDVLLQAKKEHSKCRGGTCVRPRDEPRAGPWGAHRLLPYDGVDGTDTCSAGLSSLRSRGYYGGVGQPCLPRGDTLHPLSRSLGRGGLGVRAAFAKRELLLRLAQIPGVYVPQFYAPRHDAAARYLGTFPTEEGVSPVVRRRVVKNLDAISPGQRPVVPFAETAQEHLSLEIARGCPHGCRFCQAGYTIRPYRHRSAEMVARAAQEGLDSTGLDSLSLLALNCPDHPQLERIVSLLTPRLTSTQVGLSFPSSRVDGFPLALAISTPGKRSGLTLAPEAGSERLRRTIHKNVTRSQLLDLARSASDAGWTSMKLYYMIGLPTETDEDLQAIGEEVREVLRQLRRAKVSVSLATFIPKPHTPFQWEGQADVEQVEAHQRTVLAELRDRRIKVSWHDPRQSLLEGALARGDRRIGKALLAAHSLGLRMDAWSEAFNWEGWQQAFAQAGIDPRHYLRFRQEDEPLPWDHLDCGVPKSRLLHERHRALRPTTTVESAECRVPTPLHSGGELSTLNPQPPTLKSPPPSLLPTTYYLLLFAKLADLRYLSPLELQAAFIRGLRRAGLPLAFSSGFHPKPRVSFGRALRVGTESDVLLAIINLTRELPADEVKARLGKSLPAAMPLRAVKPLDREKRKAPLHADWETALVLVQPSQSVADLDAALAAFLLQPTIPIARRPRHPETRNLKLETELFDAKPEIRSLRLVKVAPQSPGASPCTLHSALCTFWLKVSLGRGTPALCPEDVGAAFLQHLGGGSILRVKQISFGRRVPARASASHPVAEALAPSPQRLPPSRERSSRFRLRQVAVAFGGGLGGGAWRVGDCGLPNNGRRQANFAEVASATKAESVAPTERCGNPSVGEALCGLPNNGRRQSVAPTERCGNPSVGEALCGLPKPQRKRIRLHKEAYSEPGQPFLLTICTARKRPIFSDPMLAHATFASLLQGPVSSEAELIAAGLMPDHLHLVAITKGPNLVALLDRWKSYTTNLLRSMGVEGPVWQRSFYDHALRCEESLVAATEYVVNNPVRRGLVPEWHVYPYAWLSGHPVGEALAASPITGDDRASPLRPPQ